MLVNFIGDQALMFNVIFKHAYLVIMMVKNEYRYVVYIKPKREEMKKNYPDVRLDINGNIRFH